MTKEIARWVLSVAIVVAGIVGFVLAASVVLWGYPLLAWLMGAIILALLAFAVKYLIWGNEE